MKTAIGKFTRANSQTQAAPSPRNTTKQARAAHACGLRFAAKRQTPLPAGAWPHRKCFGDPGSVYPPHLLLFGGKHIPVSPLGAWPVDRPACLFRSEEHTSELQS